MDWVKQEIESKKRALAQVSKSSTVSTDAPPLKYIKRADLERQRVEEARIEAEREAAARQERLMGAAKKVARKEEETGTTLATSLEAGSSKGEERESTTKVELVKPEAFNISDDEAVRRLRNKGQPIRLFGETDKDRRLRVRALELIEERTEGQRNDFMRAMEGMEKGLDLQEMANKVGGAASSTAGEKVAEKSAKEKDKAVKKPGEENVIVDVSLVKSDPHKIYPQIYHALKVRLFPCEVLRRELIAFRTSRRSSRSGSNRSPSDQVCPRVRSSFESVLKALLAPAENIKRSTQGKMASATQQTSAEYLKPLFKSLRKRVRPHPSPPRFPP